MSTTFLRMVAVSAAAVATLTACGQDQSATSASSSTTTSAAATTPATTSAAPSTAAASSAGTSAPATSSAMTSASAGATTGKELATAIDGLQLSGGRVHTDAQLTERFRQASGPQMAALLERQAITPAACKSATISLVKMFDPSQPLAVGQAPALVVVRRAGSDEAAQSFLKAFGDAATACRTMTAGAGTETQTTSAQTLTPLTSSTAQGAVLRSETVTIKGSKPIQTSTAVGRVGAVIVQVQSSGAPDGVARDLETVAAAVTKVA